MPFSHALFDSLEVPPQTLLIEYLGQAGYRIKADKTSFLIDPYLSNYVVDGGFGPAEIFHREFPPPENPVELCDIDFIFITHDHADHCDPNTVLPLIEANPEIKIICPATAARKLLSFGVDRSRFIDPIVGQRLYAGDLAFTAVASAHYEHELDPLTGTDIYLGYVITVNDVVLYHSGDTILYPGMYDQLSLASDHFDVVCLPVNGRDAQREAQGMIGNLDAGEALELALQLQAQVMLPMHNDLFAANRVSPAILAQLADTRAPHQRIHWLKPGELYWYIQ